MNELNDKSCVCRDCPNDCINDPFFCDKHNHFSNDEKRMIAESYFKRRFVGVVGKELEKVLEKYGFKKRVP